jgi:hypothetical protein
LLITTLLVLLVSFEDPLKKNKKTAKRIKTEKERKIRDNKEEALCVFSFLLCGGAF